MRGTDKILLKRYLEEEALRGRTPKSLKLLRSKLPRLFEYLGSHAIDLNELGVKEALEYQGWLIDTGRKQGGKYQRSTILCFIKVAAGFYEFLCRTGEVYSNPFKEIRRVREERKVLRNILKEKELADLLDSLARWDEQDNLKRQVTCYKVHVIGELMYASGLRIGEVADLRVEDIDFERGVIDVVHGKGGIRRWAYLNEYAGQVLSLYISVRDLVFTAWHRRNGHLLFGTPWETLEKLVNKTLKARSDELKLGRFTSHGFRHALGYHLLRAGCNIRHIQQILGHKCLKNTEVYTKVDREALKEVFDSHHPRMLKRLRDEAHL